MTEFCPKCYEVAHLSPGDKTTSTIKSLDPMRGHPKSRYSLTLYHATVECECGVSHQLTVVNDIIKSKTSVRVGV